MGVVVEKRLGVLKKKDNRSLRWSVSIDVCVLVIKSAGVVLGSGINLVPNPRTIFSVGVRL